MTDRWARLEAACRQSVDGGAVTVEEMAEDGRAEVRVSAPVGWRLERFAFRHNKHTFLWLTNRKGADGIVLARSPDGRWTAHIIECKKTIGDKTWDYVREQLEGSCVRTDAIAGVLGIEVTAKLLYTAHRADRLGTDSPDPILAALPIGARRAPATVLNRQSWLSDELDVPGVGKLRHRRVRLASDADDVGRGTIDLSADR